MGRNQGEIRREAKEAAEAIEAEINEKELAKANEELVRLVGLQPVAEGGMDLLNKQISAAIAKIQELEV